MPPHKKFPALGRGLDALIQTEEVHTDGGSSIHEVPLDCIAPNPAQPRRDFDQQTLQELADSIAQIGIVQPITLRDIGDGRYTIIAGERRWRASQMAGLDAIPAYIRTVDDENMMEMALVENIQREDLNPIEIALAYQHLLDQYDMTQERLSERVGKSRSAVTNSLRLLKLPAKIQLALQAKAIGEGHARALLALDNPTLQSQLFDEIVRSHLSVRDVEAKVKALLQGQSITAGDGSRIRPRRGGLPEGYSMLKESLSRFFSSKVQLTCGEKGNGKITIPFQNEEDLERIVGMLDKLRIEN